MYIHVKRKHETLKDSWITFSSASKIFFLAIRNHVLCWSNLALPYTIYHIYAKFEIWRMIHGYRTQVNARYICFAYSWSSFINSSEQNVFSHFMFEIREFLPLYILFARAFFLALLLANLVNIRVRTRGHVRAREIPWNILIVANSPSSRSVPLHPPSPFCNPFLPLPLSLVLFPLPRQLLVAYS